VSSDAKIPSGAERILGEDFLGTSLECTCGRQHTILTRKVVIDAGVATRVPEELRAVIPGESVLLVADLRTWEAAGKRLSDALGPTYAVGCCLIREPPEGHIHASIELADELNATFPDEFDIVAAVGSGTVNDLAKEIAHRRRRPYFAFATAASMNGYTSAIVALLDEGLKITRLATPPVAVFADPEVLLAAPLELTLAGLGDLVSKPFCGCDWKIASLVRDEYYCPMPNRLLSQPFEKALDVFPRLADGDPFAVTELFRLLLISGLSMAITGTSSPASGGEHLLSHYWDMVRLRDGGEFNLHGAQVGVGSLVVDTLYRRIVECDFGRAAFVPNPSQEEARREIEEIFGSIAAAVWPQRQAKMEARTERDLERLCEHEAVIKEEIERTLAVGAKVRGALSAAGAPTKASQLGIGGAELAAAIRWGRLIRNRYTVLDVAAELGLLENFAATYTEDG
jgi:glycerol-1-phosphate dehydrogenase [NAD(P)+]